MQNGTGSMVLKQVDQSHGIYYSTYGDFELATKFALMSEKDLFTKVKISTTPINNSDD